MGDPEKRERGDLIRVCGLWVTKSRSGAEYLSGSLGGARILIFENRAKRGNEKAPDYQLCLAPNERRDGQGDGPTAPSPPAPAARPPAPARQAAPRTVDRGPDVDADAFPF